MGIEQNKRIAAAFFARLSDNDVGALNAMTDDATWWIAGKQGQLPVVGTHDKQQIARVFRGMLAQLRNGLAMTVMSSIAEGDKVALEVESYGELKNGRIYNQEYHFLVTIRDGKVSEVKEYLDTQHLFATWFQP